ncbi:hypothetical protein WME90_46485 [Sorangium sp. So ce375]|uniref:hypothetical protein n=1 Tax=Sorangium sp. So ce375 TaxID=3133306 RepID=UPI003F5CBC2E
MRRPSLSLCLVAVAALAYSGPGCGEDRLCAPGALSACFLPDGALGAQQCNEDGTAFGACSSAPGGLGSGCGHLSEACCPSLPAELGASCEAVAAQADGAACDDYADSASAAGFCGGAAAPGGVPYGPSCAGLLNDCCASLPARLASTCRATGFRGNEEVCLGFLERDAKASGFCDGADHAAESCSYLAEQCCPSLPGGPRERCEGLAAEADTDLCLDYLSGASDAGRCPTLGGDEPLSAAACDALLDTCCGTLEPTLAYECDLSALSGSRARCEAFEGAARAAGLCLDDGGGGAGGGCGDTSSDVDNCGFCGNVCGDQHAVPSCAAGLCSLACDLGHGDCDRDAENGCEIDFESDARNCGRCGNACSDRDASAACEDGACVLVCDAGFADCDGAPSTGCEVELGSDPFHCGACGNDCAGGACEDGTCGPGAQELASGLAVPSALAVDAGAVYVVGFRPAGGIAVRVDKASGATTCLATAAPPDDSACGSGRFEGIALTGEGAFVTGSAGVIRFPPSGAAATVVTASVPDPWALVSDGAAVWFTSLSQGGLYRTDALFAGQLAAEISGATGELGGALAADADHLYWTWADGTLMKLRKDGTEQRQIASAQDFERTNLTPQYLATDATHLFWSTPNGYLFRLGKDGSGLVALADGQPGPAGIAVDPEDGGDLYWVNRLGSVRTVPKAGGAVSTLAVGQFGAIAIAVDEAFVYWATQAGELRRIAK